MLRPLSPSSPPRIEGRCSGRFFRSLLMSLLPHLGKSGTLEEHMLLLLPHSSRGPNLDKVRGGRETGKERSASKGWRGKETEESEMEVKDEEIPIS